MNGPLIVKIMALLGFVQGIAGFLRGFNWVHIGADLFGQGLVLLPLVGAVAILRGLFLFLVALFYVLFAAGALLGKGWSRWLGLTAAIINLLLVVSAVIQGAGVGAALAWSIIPIILLIYLFSESGRTAVASA